MQRRGCTNVRYHVLAVWAHLPRVSYTLYRPPRPFPGRTPHTHHVLSVRVGRQHHTVPRGGHQGLHRGAQSGEEAVTNLGRKCYTNVQVYKL